MVLAGNDRHLNASTGWSRIRYGMALAAALLCTGSVVAMGAVDEPFFQFLPDYYADMSYRVLFNQRSEFYEDRYIGELENSVQFVAFTLGQAGSVLWDMYLRTGLGRSVNGDLPFALNEIHYRLGPIAEYRDERLLWRMGLDHGCSHLVAKGTDQPWYSHPDDDTLMDVYHNRLFVGVGSPLIRRRDYHAFYKQGEHAHCGPFVGYVEAGYYLRSLFGIIDDDALWEGNAWEWDVRGEARYALWAGRRIVLFLNNEAQVLLDLNGQAYWRDRAGLEMLLKQGRGGLEFFFNANLLDEHPRDPRKELLEAGFRVSF